MNLTISEETLRAASMTPEELRLEIAMLLYKKERLTLALAAKLAGLSRIEFQKNLSTYNATLHYDVSEFKDDIRTLKGMHRL